MAMIFKVLFFRRDEMSILIQFKLIELTFFFLHVEVIVCCRLLLMQSRTQRLFLAHTHRHTSHTEKIAKKKKKFKKRTNSW